jgi:hypothetical protein
MRVRMLAWGAVVGLLVALVTPMAAFAQAETTTTHFSDSDSYADVNPCTGATGTFSETFKGVTHSTELPDGSFHETTTVTSTFTFVPDDPNEPTYTGRSTFWDGENLNKQNNYTSTVTNSFVAKGSDGSRLTGHLVVHVTVLPDGTVRVGFEKDRVSCP